MAIKVKETKDNIKAKILKEDYPIKCACIKETDTSIKANIQSNLTNATTTNKGIVRLATLEEAILGIDNTIAITPYTLHNAGTYTEGNGINITNKIISVDDNIIATKEFVNEEINLLDNQISLINNTINSYGDIVSYNAADFATKNQGRLADSALQPNDNISELVNNVGYITGITSSDIQTALGYIPYSSENPLGFITVSALDGYATENWVGQQGYLTSSDLSGYATEVWVNNQGYIKSINNTDVINALGYTPYDNSNPAGYITSASLPTVNNSTITIQKNGLDIESFNLNQSTNKIINMTVPTQTSDLNNNSGFITNTVNNLTNYYLKSETYTKTEVQNLISGITGITIEVVNVLPASGENGVVYLVPKEGASPDIYNEYIWVETDADFELIGNTKIDLTNYVQFTDLATVATSGSYNDLSNKPTIPTVGNGIITINQGGTQKGTFTVNQSGNTTINLDGTIMVDSALSTSSTNPVQNKVITTELNKKIEGITSSDVITALGYTPYNNSNPDGYITSADLPTNYVTTDTAQDISGKKTFLGEKAIYFKQQATSNKLGFTLYNPSNTELGAFEYRPSTIGANALLNINTSYSNACYVGFRYWGTAVNIVAPKVATAGDYYIPTHITDGNTTVTASNRGTVNISTFLSDFVTNSSLATTLSDYTLSSELAPVATSGSYNDLTNKPTIPAAQVQADWNETNTSSKAYIQNKPTIPAGVVVDQTYDGTSANAQSGVAIEGELSTNYQAKLVSGTNIKTINNTSILGSGNIDTKNIFIADYGTTQLDDIYDAISEGKMVYCRYTNNDSILQAVYFQLVKAYFDILGQTTEFEFSYTLDDKIYSTKISSTINTNNGWATITYNTIPTSISNLTDNTSTYPIDKADTLTGLTASITELNYTDGVTSSIQTQLDGKATSTLSNVTAQSVANAIGYTPANLNLSNLTTTGKLVIDGQWVEQHAELSSSASAGSYNLTSALSAKLPNDTYSYEILINITANSTGSSQMSITSGIITSTEWNLWLSSNSRSASNMFIIPVNSARTLTQTNSGSNFSGAHVYLLGYRRIGSNT